MEKLTLLIDLNFVNLYIIENFSMKNIIRAVCILLVFVSCQKTKENHKIQQIDWESRKVSDMNFTDFEHGRTYLPVYSHIYHKYEKQTFDLTITVSILNVSTTDTIYILHADYYNTEGDNIRQYIKNPVFIKPMETIEIIIAEQDNEGGSGANFMFDWMIKNPKNPPLFEAVMISTYGQQGLSFTTRGVHILE